MDGEAAEGGHAAAGGHSNRAGRAGAVVERAGAGGDRQRHVGRAGAAGGDDVSIRVFHLDRHRERSGCLRAAGGPAGSVVKTTCEADAAATGTEALVPDSDELFSSVAVMVHPVELAVSRVARA